MPSGVLDQLRLVVDPDLLAVRSQITVFLIPPARDRCRRHGRPNPDAIVGVDEREPSFPLGQPLLRRVPQEGQCLRTRVVGGVGAVGRIPVDHRRLLLDQRAIPLLREPHRGLGPLALGDVARVDDHGADGRIGEQVGANRFQPPPRTVFVPTAELDPRRDPGPLGRRAEDAADAGQVVGVDDGDRLGADEFVRSPAEHPLDGGTLVGDDSLGVKERDDFRRVLDEGAEARLAAAQRRLRPRPLAHVANDGGVAGAAVGRPRRARQLHRKLLAAPAAPHHLDRARDPALIAARARGVEATPVRVTERDQQHHRGGLSQRLGGGKPEDRLGGAVPGDDGAARVNGQDRVGGRLDHRAEPRLPLLPHRPEPVVPLDLVGHQAGEDFKTGQFVVAHRGGPPVEGAEGAVDRAVAKHERDADERPDAQVRGAGNGAAQGIARRIVDQEGLDRAGDPSSESVRQRQRGARHKVERPVVNMDGPPHVVDDLDDHGRC